MYKQYLEDEQLNYQVNRFLEPYYDHQGVQTLVEQTCLNIHSLESWYTEWMRLGQDAMSAKDFGLAAAFYQLADFFLPNHDDRKVETYQLFKQTYYQSIATQNLETYNVPYENSYLPVIIIRKPTATKWLVFHGGFDSYLEELIRLALDHLDVLTDYHILLFEGPGQGQPATNGLYLTHQWEKPVSAILDYFQLNSVTLLGMSLGGYLALRAAAFEPRIEKVIAFDVFYAMMDALMMHAPDGLTEIPDLSMTKNQLLVDKLLLNYASTNIDLQFKLTKGFDITGLGSPSKLLMEISRYTLDGIEHLLTQDVLLLAGNEDMYVPTNRLDDVKNHLVNARSVETHLFTSEDGGEKHCQVGNKHVAFEKIIRFLKETD